MKARGTYERYVDWTSPVSLINSNTRHPGSPPTWLFYRGVCSLLRQSSTLMFTPCCSCGLTLGQDHNTGDLGMLLRTAVGYKDRKLMIPGLLCSAMSHEACRAVEEAAVWYWTRSLAVSRPQCCLPQLAWFMCSPGWSAVLGCHFEAPRAPAGPKLLMFADDSWPTSTSTAQVTLGVALEQLIPLPLQGWAVLPWPPSTPAFSLPYSLDHSSPISPLRKQPYNPPPPKSSSELFSRFIQSYSLSLSRYPDVCPSEALCFLTTSGTLVSHPLGSQEDDFIIICVSTLMICRFTRSSIRLINAGVTFSKPVRWSGGLHSNDLSPWDGCQGLLVRCCWLDD